MTDRTKITLADIKAGGETPGNVLTVEDSGGITSSGIHSAITVQDTATINLELTGQALSGYVIPGGISHTNLADIGTNSHATIDSHIDNTAIHFDELGELSDVTVTGASQGDVLAYDGADWTPSGIMIHAAIPCFSFKNASEVSTGDGAGYLPIPAALDGYDVVYVHAEVKTAGTTGTTDIQIRNETQSQDILSTKLTIDSGETGSDTAATPAVINLSNDNLSAYDVLAIDVDAVSSTAPRGLIVTIGMRK
jgi:hypothetical protein